MILGQDQAVVYPVADLYDSGMMNSYLSAIRGEYERGIREQEDFISKYGDFISPFSKDVDTWNQLTMDPVEKAYDDLMRSGIDPIRTQEGRSYLQKVIRDVPRQKLSKLRQSAKIGQEYLENRAKLQAQGLWNPEFENFLLGGQSFDAWDTMGNGMWNRTSPMEYRDVDYLTNPWMKNLQPMFDAKLTAEKNDGFDYYTTPEDRIRGVIRDNMSEFLLSDYGKFFYNNALNTARATASAGETEDQTHQRARQILEDTIYTRNSDWRREKRETNPYAMEELRYKNEVKLANLKHAQALARQKAAQGGEEQPNYPASFTATVNTAAGDKFDSTVLNNLPQIIQAKKSFYETWLNKNKNKKGTTTYNKIKTYYNWWKNAGKDSGAFVSRDQFGVIRPTKFAVDKFNEYENYLNRSQKQMSVVERRYLNNRAYTLSGETDSIVKNSISTGSSKLTGVTDNNNSYKTVTFGRGNTQLQRTRISDVQSAKLAPKTPSREFNEYLKKNHITAYIAEDNAQVVRLPSKTGRSGMTDVYYDVYVPTSVVEDYAKTYGRKIGSVERDFGLRKEIVGNSGTASNKKPVKMYKLSVSTTQKDDAVTSRLNIATDKQNYGATNTYNLAPNRQGEALENAYRGF